MEKVTQFLKDHQSSTPSRWKEDFEWRKANWGWLRYSQYIAIRMMSRMDELHMTQVVLAEKMGCSQQYVSKILKGNENLSLESIWKIESILDIDLVKTALSSVSGYNSMQSQYLNDSCGEGLDPDCKTHDLVGGYKLSRKTEKKSK